VVSVVVAAPFLRIDDVADHLWESRRPSPIEVRNCVPCDLIDPRLDTIGLRKRANLFYNPYKHILKYVVGIRLTGQSRTNTRTQLNA
jgi:hypothetical protein